MASGDGTIARQLWGVRRHGRPITSVVRVSAVALVIYVVVGAETSQFFTLSWMECPGGSATIGPGEKVLDGNPSSTRGPVPSATGGGSWESGSCRNGMF